MKQDLHTHKFWQFKPQESQTASPLHTHTEHGTAAVEGSTSRSLNVHPSGTDLGHGWGIFGSGGGATPPPGIFSHRLHICGHPVYGIL